MDLQDSAVEGNQSDDKSSQGEPRDEEVKITIDEKKEEEKGKEALEDIKSDEEGEDILKKKDSKTKHKEKPSMFLFPITRMKLAWARSSNIFEFSLRVIAIIFTTLGWFFCVGGVPLMSLAMLIVGSIFVDDCTIQPNIPVYLIVAGLLGTVQHFLAVWTKYVPKETQGRLGTVRSYCKVVDYLLHIFLAIWFILGCVWVYGIRSEVKFEAFYEEEYCHKTVYLFAFWILNISFIFLSILIVGSFCCILFLVTKSEEEYMP